VRRTAFAVAFVLSELSSRVLVEAEIASRYESNRPPTPTSSPPPPGLLRLSDARIGQTAEVSDVRHVTHQEPAWRDRTNYIIQVDLESHGMPSGTLEQIWARTDDNERFEVCCLPFFTYGIALGDTVLWNENDRIARVATSSGRRLVRSVFVDREDAAASHEAFHGSLVETGALLEFSGSGFAAIDIDSDERLAAVMAILDPLHEAGRLSWEWGRSSRPLAG